MSTIIDVRSLVKKFPLEKGFLSFFLKQKFVHAVSGVSFSVRSGETMGLVGESGCGKTTLGKCILRLIEPTSGKIFFDGVDLMSLNTKKMRELRPKMQLIFQDPFSSLNPRKTAREIVGRPLELHNIATEHEKDEKAAEMLRSVGIEKEKFDRFPHQFSGGERQRIAIARALVVNPKFVVADEPVSSLDVSIQSQILNLFQELKEKYKFTCLFISHDLIVVESISTSVAVMYLGKIVEIASTEELFNNPIHPYTKSLLSSVSVPDPKVKPKRIVLPGEVPSPIYPPPGCKLHPRCPYAKTECSQVEPELKNAGSGHMVACHVFA